MTLTPFYLDQVQKAPTDLVSAVQAILGLMAALSTRVYSYIFQKLEKKTFMVAMPSGDDLCTFYN